jgi:hypothetical protein
MSPPDPEVRWFQRGAMSARAREVPPLDAVYFPDGAPPEGLPERVPAASSQYPRPLRPPPPPASCRVQGKCLAWATVGRGEGEECAVSGEH